MTRLRTRCVTVTHLTLAPRLAKGIGSIYTLAAALLAPSLALAQTSSSALSLNNALGYANTFSPAAFDTSAAKFGAGALIPSTAPSPVSIAVTACDLRNALSSGVWSLSFWAKFPSSLPSSTQAIISIGSLYLAEASSAYGGPGGLTLADATSSQLNASVAAPTDAGGTSVLTDGLWHNIEIDYAATSYGAPLIVTNGTVPNPTGLWMYSFIDGKTLTGLNLNGSGRALSRPDSITLGALGPTLSNRAPWSGELDEIALWSGLQHPLPALTNIPTSPPTTVLLAGAQAFTPPTSPYVGNETGLLLLYHLDGNGLDSGPTIAASPVGSNGGGTLIAQPTCGGQ